MTLAGDPRLARAAHGLLAVFNQAGVIAPGEVHTVTRLGRLFGESDERVLLAAALALRGTRYGHVCVDLERLADTIAVDGVDQDVVDGLAWPGEGWMGAVAASPMTGHGEPDRPLVVDGDLLYTERMWEFQSRLADRLLARAAHPADGTDALVELLGRMFDGRDSLQVAAAVLALTSRLTVIAGGPGTGKTYAIARIVGAAVERAITSGERLPHVAVAAPTGKAAARLTEQLHDFAASGRLSEQAATVVGELEAVTIHRLLGSRPGRGGFRHDGDSRLPHDLVVIDETSMVSLPMAARIVDATRPSARLVLVGDPDQLASIEAGTVLADLVGEARDRVTLGPDARARIEQVAPGVLGETDGATSGPLADHVLTLDRGHRFDERSAVAEVADAIRHGDADRVIAELAVGREGLSWVDPGERTLDRLHEVLVPAIEHARALIELASAGMVDEALERLSDLALLCAHREGPVGVSDWVQLIEQRTRTTPGWTGVWYPGRPVMVRANDYRLRLFNGDIGVTVAVDGTLQVAFPDASGARLVGPGQLSAIEGVQAMTIHKSQGSQFRRVIILVPGQDSRLLTRELLYTAVTRAEQHVTVVGSEGAIRDAVNRPVTRASGLRERLWSRR
jgi:exodeoxyribonuclease V alpha subunit